MLQTPAKWCFLCSRVYNNNNPRYLSFSWSYKNAFFVSCRGLSTAFPKEKNISDAIRSRRKRKVNNTRRPVSFNVAGSIYSSHGISDSAAGEVNTKTTSSGIGLKSRRPHIPLQMINFKEIRNEMLLQILKDEVLSPTKYSLKQIRKLENAFVYKLKELTIHEMFSVARCFFQIYHRAPKYLTSLFEYIDNNFDEDLSKVKALVDAHSEIEKSIDRTRSVIEYPESISDTVVGSAFLKIFPQELISLMLEEKTVRILQGLRGLEKKMQMHFIHHTVNIECPNYSGPKLKQFMVEQFELKNRERSVQFELDTRPGLLTLFQELTSILGEKKVHCHMILPHFTTADIEIHLDANNQPLSFVPETISTESKESYSWKTQQEVTFTLLQMLQNPLQNLSSISSAPQISRRIAIEVCGRNQCALNQNRWLLGIYRTKLRQLSAVGYEVLLFMPEDIAELKNEICSEKRKEWVLQKVIQKLNINCGIQNQ
ncbi:unnamed protein product [Acanthosepion pharaonis]|uniref:FAST kinase-like protein subdomain 2 domain-containing protein n=1 Tax=Acanthosepion pharaonis TaxID=158019 RepID=A0A812D867_ACAPH|nr:unnamed protein product [Sepia pharaonis]